MLKDIEARLDMIYCRISDNDSGVILVKYRDIADQRSASIGRVGSVGISISDYQLYNETI